MVQVGLPRVLTALYLEPPLKIQTTPLIQNFPLFIAEENAQQLLLMPILGIEVALLRADCLELKSHKNLDGLGRRVQMGLEFDEHAADLIHVAAKVLNAVGQGVIVLQGDELRQLIGL